MQLSARFPIAVHILLSVGLFSEQFKMTSDFIASSVGVNPVVIRRILSSLKKAGLVDVAAGTGGASLSVSPDRITLLDVYHAVDLLEDRTLFAMHMRPNPQCPVGRSIQDILSGHMEAAQSALETNLQSVTLDQLMHQVPPV